MHGTIPSEFGVMERLIAINLYNNSFTGTIPMEVLKHEGLQFIWIPQNKFTGSIPSELGLTRNLTGQQDDVD